MASSGGPGSGRPWPQRVVRCLRQRDNGVEPSSARSGAGQDGQAPDRVYCPPSHRSAGISSGSVTSRARPERGAGWRLSVRCPRQRGVSCVATTRFRSEGSRGHFIDELELEPREPVHRSYRNSTSTLVMRPRVNAPLYTDYRLLEISEMASPISGTGCKARGRRVVRSLPPGKELCWSAAGLSGPFLSAVLVAGS